MTLSGNWAWSLIALCLSWGPSPHQGKLANAYILKPIGYTLVCSKARLGWFQQGLRAEHLPRIYLSSVPSAVTEENSRHMQMLYTCDFHS